MKRVMWFTAVGVVLAATAASAENPGAAPAAGGGKRVPLYVDSKTTKEHFQDITAADMDMLRTKKILFTSRSFGLNLCAGLKLLAARDKKHDLLSAYERYDVFGAGGNLGIIPTDVFKDKKFVHFLGTAWPHTKRVEEMDQLLRQKPHEFGKVVDIVVVLLDIANPETFDLYSATMDALRRDFPKIRFIYVTAGFKAAVHAKENEQDHAFSEKVRARYKGRVPLYDLGAILSDDFRAGHAFCPEYSRDPAGVHPNLDAGEIMMAEGFLLVLRDACKWNGAAPTLPRPTRAVRPDRGSRPWPPTNPTTRRCGPSSMPMG